MFRVDPTTRHSQTLASDPQGSAWVSANAGSGKTTVLTKRVKRLLLMGVEPSRILCLTFTKAAAANMANRVLRDLSEWVALDDMELRASIADLEDCPPASISPAQMARARRIFATALETPGGLKIQTIHAFCDALLHQFPFEAGVSGGFRIVDDTTRIEMVSEARACVIHDALRAPDSEAGQALAILTDFSGEEHFTRLLDEALQQADLLRALMEGDEALEHAAARIHQTLGLAGDETPQGLEARIMGEALLPPGQWGDVINALCACGANSSKRGEALWLALMAPDEAARRRAYFDVFRKKDGGMYAPKSLVVKKLDTEYRELAERLLEELARLTALDHLMRREQTARVSKAVMLLAGAVLAHVEARKARAGLLDFPDLVNKAAQLLSSGAGDWVRWKLDRGIDHILVDEAQDTSEEQWSVITSLAAEFFAGEGTKARTERTIFAVGDDKQSIFSFQGAKPQLFGAQKADFARKAQLSGRSFHDVKLHLSFRSAPSILKAVDTVFAREAAATGVTYAAQFPPHEAARHKAGGMIELWPPTSGESAPAGEAWDHPLDEVPSTHARIVLAHRIANQIRAWLDHGESIEGREGPRAMTPGDILILVRTRNPLFAAIIRALKDRGVPVSGADRLTLIEHIAVMDLMALGDHILLPQDDLTLASLLKSPLIGLDDTDLMALCAGREGSLVDTLAARAHEQPPWLAAWQRLRQWQASGTGARPYDFYARVLGADGGRTALLQRLGREAGDAIDEFLNAALAYEAGHTPNLQGFLVTLRGTRAQVKREMDQGSDEVRVMTAHNAKGLEAKVVILPDTMSLPDTRKRPPLLPVLPDDGGPPLLLYTAFGKDDIAPIHAATELYDAGQLAEYRRLLYVALTRAEDRLLVAGAAPAKGEAPDGSWYNLISEALIPQARAVTAPDGAVLHHVWPADAAPSPPFEQKSRAMPTAEPERPDWARPAPLLARQRTSVAPSRAMEAQGQGSALALARGELMHRLLQDLPAHAAQNREELARRFMANNHQLHAACGLDDAVSEALVQEALRVLTMPLFEAQESEQVFAELPLSGSVCLPDGRSIPVNGQIDRLVVSATRVQIIDYKTGTPARRVPESYAAQLGLYAGVIGQIFPGRAIEAALLWTQSAQLVQVSAQEQAQALVAFAARSKT